MVTWLLPLLQLTVAPKRDPQHIQFSHPLIVHVSNRNKPPITKTDIRMFKDNIFNVYARKAFLQSLSGFPFWFIPTVWSGRESEGARGINPTLRINNQARLRKDYHG